MSEQDKREYCLLWQQARDLAMERGLEMSPLCPMEKTCSGEHCVFIEPLKKLKDTIYDSDE